MRNNKLNFTGNLVVKTALIWFILFASSAHLSSAQDEKQTLRFARARAVTSQGTEFYLCFERNFRESKNPGQDKNAITLKFYITSEQNATVEIVTENPSIYKTVEVSAGAVVEVDMARETQVTGIETIERKGVHITSDVPIAVYGVNHRFQTTDTYLGIPVQALGTEYRVVGYSLSEGLSSQFAIVATEEETEVTITPTALTAANHNAGVPYTIQMKPGDVYQVATNPESPVDGDLTGSLITSNKKIAVFSGHQCAYVPNPLIGCNFLTEQLPPVSAWGNDFYVGMLKSRKRHTIRAVAAESDTKLYEDSRLVAELKAGQFYDNPTVQKALHITSDKPILLAQYSQGFSNGDSLGDPMMMLIAPTRQYLSEYRFATPIGGEWNHYINVVIPTSAIPSLWINGNQVSSDLFNPIGSGVYSVASLRLSFGSFSINADQPFGLSSYGFGYRSQAYDAYGNVGGQAYYGLPLNVQEK